MTRYILRRAGTSLLLLVLASILVFLVLRVVPGDPTITKLGEARGIDPRAAAELRHQIGLDRSLPEQYWSWISGFVHGDFGKSYFSQFPVTTLIGERVGATLELALLSLALGLLIAVPAALFAAVRRSRWLNAGLSGFTTFGMATPPFLVGIVLIIVFSIKLNVLPARGYVSCLHDPAESLKAALLPAITLSIAVAAPLLRVLRASLADGVSAPYIRTAEGKGLLWRQVVLRHLAPNAAIPALTVLGVIVGSLLGGTVVVEFVFGREGLGTLVIDSVEKRDYAVLQTLVLLAVGFFVLTTLAVDLLYGVLDPRLRAQRVEA